MPRQWSSRRAERTGAMQIICANELERLVRETFPGKLEFSAEAELGVDPHRRPIVTFVHGGPDPFLDRQFEDWLGGARVFVAAHQLLNRLCRAGALAPGQYALTRPLESRADRARVSADISTAVPATLKQPRRRAIVACLLAPAKGRTGEMQR